MDEFKEIESLLLRSFGLHSFRPSIAVLDEQNHKPRVLVPDRGSYPLTSPIFFVKTDRWSQFRQSCGYRVRRTPDSWKYFFRHDSWELQSRCNHVRRRYYMVWKYSSLRVCNEPCNVDRITCRVGLNIRLVYSGGNEFDYWLFPS